MCICKYIKWIKALIKKSLLFLPSICKWFKRRISFLSKTPLPPSPTKPLSWDFYIYIIYTYLYLSISIPQERSIIYNRRKEGKQKRQEKKGNESSEGADWHPTEEPENPFLLRTTTTMWKTWLHDLTELVTVTDWWSILWF